MSHYRTVKTTMGHRYTVRMAEDERKERMLYWMAITVLPFVTAAGMMLIWLKGV